MNGPTSQQEVVDFYDSMTSKLTHDYIHRNARVVSAISGAVKRLSSAKGSLLDLGCGIGWTSYALAKELPNINSVVATDISPNNIRVAQRLFPHPRIEFSMCRYPLRILR